VGKDCLRKELAGRHNALGRIGEEMFLQIVDNEFMRSGDGRRRGDWGRTLGLSFQNLKLPKRSRVGYEGKRDGGGERCACTLAVSIGGTGERAFLGKELLS